MLRLVPVLIAPGLLFAQIPRIGPVEVFGLRSVPEDRVRSALGVTEGDRLPASKSILEQRVEEVPGVHAVSIEAVCCTGDRAVLYVGIEERNGPHYDFRDAPSGQATLPPDAIKQYRGYVRAFELAARSGAVTEDFSKGHALASDPAIRRFQDRFRVIARDRLATLRNVLRNSSDAEQRAAAAAIIGYARRKADVVPDLTYALRDPDNTVRGNAARALGISAATGGAAVDPAPLTAMLDSIVWSDRHRAADALVILTGNRPEAIAGLRVAVPELLEMARWKTPAHAHPAFVLLGRLEALSDADIEKAWAGDRAIVLQRFTQE